MRSRPADQWRGKTALITGASSGIGAAAARKLAGEGLTVLLAARRLDRLQALAEQIQTSGGQARVMAADLSVEAERAAVFAWAEAAGGVDVLINNAGLGWYGYFSQMPWADAVSILQVNINAAVHLTRLFLPGMLARSRGAVINIGSVSGGLPSQGIAVYGASKAFLDNFTSALHRELRGSGVHAGVLRVGPVTSEFYPNAAARSGRRVPAERFAIPAERVAGCIWAMIQHPRRKVYLPGIYCLTPVVEFCFGWLIDWAGPLLLRQKKSWQG